MHIVHSHNPALRPTHTTTPTQDTVRVVREQMSLCSIATSGIFHATLEDNVAIATVQPPSLRDVHDVCKMVGLDALANEYPVCA